MGLYNDLHMKFSVAVLLGVTLASAQIPSIDQSLEMKSVQSAEISPDGRFVAYTVQETNWEDNEFVQQIWIAMLATRRREEGPLLAGCGPGR